MKLFGHDITQIICNSIDIIVTERLAKAPFDRTIMGIIQSFEGVNNNEQKASAKYKISFQDSTFYAYDSIKTQRYNKGDLVYILVPENDFSKQKVIIGLAESGAFIPEDSLKDKDANLLIDLNGKSLLHK